VIYYSLVANFVLLALLLYFKDLPLESDLDHFALEYIVTLPVVLCPSSLMVSLSVGLLLNREGAFDLDPEERIFLAGVAAVVCVVLIQVAYLVFYALVRG
jgi:hypothetical protein